MVVYVVVCLFVFWYLYPSLCAAALTHPSFFHLILWVLLSGMSHRLTSTVLFTLAFFLRVLAPSAQTSCVRRAAWERRGEAVPPSLQTACWGSRFLCYHRSFPHVHSLCTESVSADWSRLHFCHAGHGSESNRAYEYPEQNHWKA